MEQELQQLRQQNALQQEVIRQLLSFNQILKQKLKQAGIEIDTEETIYSTSPAENDKKEALYSIPATGIGIKGANDSISRSENGIDGANDTIRETWIGINGTDDSLSQSGNGTNGANDSHLQAGNGIKGENSTLPERINMTHGNIASLAVSMRQAKVMHMNFKRLLKVAKLLIHIYNGGRGTINDLKGAADYSKSGMAKLMMNLRKKGIVVKHKVRDHRLSGKGLQLLKNARFK